MRLQTISKLDFDLYRSQIVDLYISSFSTGDAAQLLNSLEVRDYFFNLFEKNAKAILCFDGTRVVAVLVYCPLVLDADLPMSISDSYDVSKAVYIAELMVDADFRGLGIAKSLLTEFDRTIISTSYTDVFIRVWDNNAIALRLYEKAGFRTVDSIIQTKMSADAHEILQMNKIYLWRDLTLSK